MFKTRLAALSAAILFLGAKCAPIQSSGTIIKPTTTLSTSAVHTVPTHSASPQIANNSNEGTSTGGNESGGLLDSIGSTVGNVVGSVANDSEELVSPIIMDTGDFRNANKQQSSLPHSPRFIG
ncbi:uncharacterized protein FOMMEDRAFT_151909 [Fomitiporia mediterranea MF3/22]|uniref:uncharacterized protein n=1 Tax=Fomitiporia mediterranea (strain MF3/22) TaxID=694068 RepID=UPI0004408068|nr:uncharacterized protein FOMMEDRAFT_151909 [Fomitiporia mediterranea MF3/22]EJD06624.1 hypothetical protein FOMMEDRAFT_151909 [Fomitiporia mediterranea MF3/22]